MKSTIVTRKILLSLTALMLLMLAESKAQLVIDTAWTDPQLAQLLAGQGVVISNVSVTCPSHAYGFFDGTNSNFGIDSGIVLTSGNVFNAIGPNDESGTTGYPNYFSGPNCDAQLDAICAQPTYDCCIFEFDVVPIGDTLQFDYVFGSDEYLEYVGSINDVFGFFISGPGIVGQQNVALVPGTSTPVSIGNVNDVSNAGYYYNNGDGFTAPQNTDPEVLQYDGFTQGLYVEAVVIPCETYHIKMAISDAADGILDSGVFIEAGSFSSYGITLETNSSVGGGFLDAVEGCVDGYFIISISYPVTDTLIVNINIGGSATFGTDYSAFPNTITFIPGGPDSIVIPIVAIDDFNPDGGEDVMLWLTGGCNLNGGDTASIFILEHHVEAGPDISFCTGDSAMIGMPPIGGYSYQWDPVTGLNDATASQTTLILTNNGSSTQTTNYEMMATDTVGCISYDDLDVSVYAAPPADAGPADVMLFGDQVSLDGSGGVTYHWEPNYELSDQDIENPVASPTLTTTYTVTVTDANGCVATDTVTIEVLYEYDVYVPNAFSPNGDENNDEIFIIVTGDYVLDDWIIYNRWGQEVYRTNDPLAGWDGTSNGKIQDLGVYIYYGLAHDPLGNGIEIKGNITLLK